MSGNQFSDDGRTVMATSNDQTVSLYDLASGIRLGDPIPIESPLSYGGFLRPDGLQVAVTARGGVVTWNLESETLLDAACRLAGRNLTATEWSAYMSGFGLAARPAPPQVDRTIGQSCDSEDPARAGDNARAPR